MKVKIIKTIAAVVVLGSSVSAMANVKTTSVQKNSNEISKLLNDKNIDVISRRLKNRNDISRRRKNRNDISRRRKNRNDISRRRKNRNDISRRRKNRNDIFNLNSRKKETLAKKQNLPTIL